MMIKFLSGLILILLVLTIACKYDNSALDCSTITGATYNSNGGKIESIVINKCSGAACHSSGGTGSIHWTVGSYETLGTHFFDEAVESLKNGEMPPAGSPKLTGTELDQIECWADSGYPK
jgi:hypothetical protein